MANAAPINRFIMSASALLANRVTRYTMQLYIPAEKPDAVYLHGYVQAQPYKPFNGMYYNAALLSWRRFIGIEILR